MGGVGRGRALAIVAVLLGCGGDAPEAAPEGAALEPRESTAEVVPPRFDSVAAAVLRDSALATLATLVPAPARASFDSVVVVQPPAVDGRLPAMAACGRIGGLPGRGAPVRFVYQSKWTVFVEENANRAAFAELWAKSCAAPGATSAATSPQ